MTIAVIVAHKDGIAVEPEILQYTVVIEIGHQRHRDHGDPQQGRGQQRQRIAPLALPAPAEEQHRVPTRPEGGIVHAQQGHQPDGQRRDPGLLPAKAAIHQQPHKRVLGNQRQAECPVFGHVAVVVAKANQPEHAEQCGKARQRS